MSKLGPGLLATALLFLGVAPAGAQPRPIESYIARLSRAD